MRCGQRGDRIHGSCVSEGSICQTCLVVSPWLVEMGDKDAGSRVRAVRLVRCVGGDRRGHRNDSRGRLLHAGRQHVREIRPMDDVRDHIVDTIPERVDISRDLIGDREP